VSSKPARTRDDDVLERNVSSLLEAGGEPPMLDPSARARIRAELIARHGAPERAPTSARPRRTPLLAIACGVAALAAVLWIASRLTGDAAAPVGRALADGSSWILGPGGKVTPLGDRHVRVDGAVLLDVVPGRGTFVVETARGRIEVLGTRFLVDASADRTTTSVVRGKVRLATPHGDVLLHAGEQGVAEPGRPPTRGPAPRLSHLMSWAAEARRGSETALAPLHRGSLFARDPGVRNGQLAAEQPLPLAKLGVDVVVENQVARVALDQTFHNPHARVLEGVYRFAIPPDAALQRLAMYVDGKLTESAVVERMRARRIYEELVYRRVDPALLEWAGAGRLSLRVYPLPAHQDKRLVLAYTQSLARLYGDYTLTVPLPALDQPVGELAFDVTVRGCAQCELASPSHAITVARRGEDAIATYRGAGERLGDSLVLHVRDPRRDTRVARHRDGDADYLLVRANPDLPRTPRVYRPRTWVILDDASASRSALERRAQAALIDAFVEELDEEDRLAVISFDVTARTKLAPTRVLDVDRAALREAVGAEGGVGATDIGAALDAAAGLLAGTAADDAMIVYLGDGVLTSGARTLDAIRGKLAGTARFVGVGIGDGPDTQVLEALAAATGGYATTIDLADDVRWRAFDLVAALHTTRVTGLSARLVDADGALVPATLYVRAPQLTEGEELEIVARLAGPGAPVALELSGTLDGATWQRRIELAAATTLDGDHRYLPRLWAQRHIAARLLAKHEPVVLAPCTARCPTEAEARAQRDEEIRREVVALGTRYFLLSRHTSLIVLDDDAMYARYGVRKGTGETWAPYALPAAIPVGTRAPVVVPADVSTDAELVRAPSPLFHLGLGAARAFDRGPGWIVEDPGWGTTGRGRIGAFGAIGARTRSPGSGTGAGYGVGGERRTRGDLGLVRREAEAQQHVTGAAPSPDAVRGADVAEPKAASAGHGVALDDGSLPAAEAKRKRVLASELSFAGGGWAQRDALASAGPLRARGLSSPNDPTFDDLTAFVPALFPDDSDAWRERLDASRGGAPYPIDDAARARLVRARQALPAGVYRWGERELAVDRARRIGWRRTTETDLVETAAFDGTTWTRRYAELGLEVMRSLDADVVALSLAYLPIWIAEPAHYARYFEVRAHGPHHVALHVPPGAGAPAELAYVLELDARDRLVAIRDAAGRELVAVTWDAAGPVAARVEGRTLHVGFTPLDVADATTWAHGGAASEEVRIELPTRLPAYWQARVARESAGSAAWRHAQRQLLASLAATGDRAALLATYEALRAQGGVRRGDLVLASAGIASASTDAQRAAALAPFHEDDVVRRYLLAGRAYAKTLSPARLAPPTTAGMIGALWQLREITALLAHGKGTDGVDRLVALGDRAVLFRLVAASLVASHYRLAPADIGRAWDTVAVGSYRNVARAQAALGMMNRGAYDAGAARVAALVDELDLDAVPPRLERVLPMVQYSRRGAAGARLVWTRWRDRVLASSSFAHVMSLVPAAGARGAELARILGRAAELAGEDVERRTAVIDAALRYGAVPLAASLLEPLLAAHPRRDLHLLAAELAEQQGRAADVLAHLEAAQDAGADEAVEISTVRGELALLLDAARALAIASTGAERQAAIERALRWGTRWRAIDPGNPDVDRRLGHLLLAAGETTEAWRQLSTVIEREPMSGDGYQIVAEAFEQQGRVEDALAYWQQAIVLDQTNPTPRLRKAQALIALGRTADGDALLREVASRRWHDIWSGVVYQAKYLLERGKPSSR